jgi:outer membrane cobalamin receptor
MRGLQRFLLFSAVIFSSQLLMGATGNIIGTVKDIGTAEPLTGANVVVVGSSLGAAARSDGSFIISKVPPGVYTIEASIIGYERKRVENVSVRDNDSTTIHFQLREEAVSLREVVVTPGHFSLMQKEVTAKQTLKPEDIRTVSQLGEDVYRAVTRLPGLSGNDYSSKFTVRGGEQDEVLVLLDGLELYDPFHLKDLTGAISVIDVEAIGGINLLTGAFPAEYGDRLSGVFDIKTVAPSLGKRRTSAALSFMNARFLSEGTFAKGKGQWLVLARRGYIDLVLKIASPDDDLSPVYYDVLSKLQYQFNSNHALGIHVLQADDDLEVVEDEDTAITGYGSTYSWLTWYANFSSKLFAQTVLSIGTVNQKRRGLDIDGNDRITTLFEVSDRRDFDFYGLKQDWSYEFSRRFLLKWGFDAKRLTANYDYFNQDRDFVEMGEGNFVAVVDTTDIDLKPSGNEIGFYLSNRVRVLDPVTAEIGLRYDHASWSGDKKISPRINLALSLAEQTNLRFGWGKFHQSQGLHELDVQDGDDQFRPAELAEHRVIGLEHAFSTGINLRVEAYQKKLSGLRPRFQNLSNQLEFFPEVEHDRLRVQPQSGEARGIEIFVKRDAGGKFSWWGSYGLAVAEDKIDGVTVPRNFDQRHTIYLDFNYRPNPKWSLNVAWQYHSGWPFTEATIERETLPNGFLFRRVYGPLNGARFPAYHRMDVRVNRYFHFTNSRLSLFLELRNLYNRKNSRAFEYSVTVFRDGSFVVNRSEEHWLPLLPSIGISYDF